jgi:hypothetical protein
MLSFVGPSFPDDTILGGCIPVDRVEIHLALGQSRWKKSAAVVLESKFDPEIGHGGEGAYGGPALI